MLSHDNLIWSATVVCESYGLKEVRNSVCRHCIRLQATNVQMRKCKESVVTIILL